MPQKLFLIPNVIHPSDNSLNSDYLFSEIKDVRIFFTENEKSARQLLKKLNPQVSFQEIQLFPLSEHTTPETLKEYVQIITEHDTGVISEAGCPCIADPGADLVLLAHRNAVEVIPLVGPSSILLAIMASGLNGQNFAFVGYLPKEQSERIQKIKALERRSFAENQTQIFMDTPYRNQHVFDDVLAHCEERTLLCLACELEGNDQVVKTMPISSWRIVKPVLKKEPALFLLLQK